ncbi:ACT domain-containing protein [Rhizobium sp. KVB221]|uniref:ACT domain-containing protein n=1 Tax=Rhizobium setariae TaxID=2801340 RepID=A0A937CMU8_9HYPH|nr:ACT domain-containing protein [Rhizobium setariae]MBL0370418.1 ACT domain-containing protein [Rhizobium setariae]
MTGITHIAQLLTSMEPELQPGEFVFCALPAGRNLAPHIEPLGLFAEKEGRTAIVDAESAKSLDYPKSLPMRQISLTVHSSLEAVGLTAAISAELARHDISANVVAAYYHDHIFVPSSDAVRAVEALRELSRSSAGA